MEKLYRVQMNKNGMPNFSTAAEVEPCKDAISREYALGVIYPSNIYPSRADIFKALKDAPSVTVEPKKVCIGQVHFDDEKLHEIVDEATKKLKEEIQPKQGEWIVLGGTDLNGISYCAKCSNCKAVYDGIRLSNYSYCPNCGAQMKGEDE